MSLAFVPWGDVGKTVCQRNINNRSNNKVLPQNCLERMDQRNRQTQFVLFVSKLPLCYLSWVLETQFSRSGAHGMDHPAARRN